MLFALFVRAFSSTLITHLARLRFFSSGFVVSFGPMAAIRTEVPGISVASASIGLCHGVLGFVWKVLG